MTMLIPNRLLFDFEFRLHYRSRSPKIDGSLAEWSDAELLPPFCTLEDITPFAPVWACWNETGLYVACQVERKRHPLRCDPKVYWKSDNLRICTDMRDARRNKRATRFCQQFYFLPRGGGRRGEQAVGGSAKIHRAREDAPLFSSEGADCGSKERGELRAPAAIRNPQSAIVRVASRVWAGGYGLEAHIPAECLVGFDPAEHGRIGFYYILEDRDHGQQYLTVGDDLNWHIDPSTWATAVLAR